MSRREVSVHMGSLSRGSISGVSDQGGVSVSVSLSRGSLQGSLSGESLSRDMCLCPKEVSLTGEGVSMQGVSVQG